MPGTGHGKGPLDNLSNSITFSWGIQGVDEKMITRIQELIIARKK